MRLGRKKGGVAEGIKPGNENPVRLEFHHGELREHRAVHDSRLSNQHLRFPRATYFVALVK
jgi:hypothetical protein